MSVITVGAEKGGVAKTRVSTHIATLAKAEGADVVLLDTDPQGSAISWNNIRKSEEVEPQLSVIALPPNPAKEVKELSSKYDLVVVDIGAQNYRTMLECAALSDLVLVPCGADQQEIESTLKVFDTLKQMVKLPKDGGLPAPIPAYVVLTRVSNLENAKATRELREYFASEGVPVFDSHIAYRTSWLTTGKSGRAVHELKGKERSQKAIDEMQAVYEEVKRKVAASQEVMQ